MKIKAFFDKIKLKMKKRKKIKTRIEKVKFNKKIELSKYKILIIILQIILILILFCTLILFATSLIAILDNVKIYGVALLMFSVSSFFGFLVILLDRKLYGLKTNHSLTFIVFITLMVMMSLGVGYTSYDYFKIDFVNDISEKYSMSHETFNYKFYKNKNLNIHFNSWYKNTYIIEFDNALENSVKIDVKYYKSFYDLNSKNEGSNIYISLANDIRDVTSMYLENLKENKIYNEKELSRYTIKIYVSEENYERLVIFN